MIFSSLKSLTTPRGNVTKITDTSGRVLWSAVKPMVTITITLPSSDYSGLSSVTVDGITYPNEENATGTVTLEVPIGTEITCSAEYDAELAAGASSPYSAYIQVNGRKLAEGDGSYSHTFIVESDTSIALSAYTYYSSGVYYPYAGFVTVEYFALNSIILRPSSDISVDDTIALTPSDATAAYLLINEEVCDGEATNIGISGTVSDGYAKFTLDGSMPEEITHATNIYIVLSTYIERSHKATGARSSITVNDTTTYAFESVYDNTNYNPKQCYVSYNSTTGATVTADDVLAEINTYISENGVLPDIKLDLYLGIGAEDGNKATDVAKISQAYVVIEYE